MVGPLVEQIPSGVCSAFLAQREGHDVVYTAAHCLGSKTKLWLPGLEGNAQQLRESRWSQVRPFPPEDWQHLPRQDVAWAPASLEGTALLTGPLPVPGDRLVVWGYPEGKGATRLECAYRGVALLDDRSQARPRPEMECGKPRGFVRHTGFSGGPVLNAQGHVVGVLVSGTRSASGEVRLGFEPLRPWLKEGWSRHRASLAWDTPLPQSLEMKVASGQLVEYRLVSPDGVTWTQGVVASPADTATLSR